MNLASSYRKYNSNLHDKHNWIYAKPFSTESFSNEPRSTHPLSTKLLPNIGIFLALVILNLLLYWWFKDNKSSKIKRLEKLVAKLNSETNLEERAKLWIPIASLAMQSEELAALLVNKMNILPTVQLTLQSNEPRETIGALAVVYSLSAVGSSLPVDLFSLTPDIVKFAKSVSVYQLPFQMCVQTFYNLSKIPGHQNDKDLEMLFDSCLTTKIYQPYLKALGEVGLSNIDSRRELLEDKEVFKQYIAVFEKPSRNPGDTYVVLSNLANTYEKSAFAKIALGYLCYQIEFLDHAEESFLKALALKPKDKQAHLSALLGLGLTSMQLKKKEKAKNTFLQIIQQDPEYVPLLCLLNDFSGNHDEILDRGRDNLRTDGELFDTLKLAQNNSKKKLGIQSVLK